MYLDSNLDFPVHKRDYPVQIRGVPCPPDQRYDGTDLLD